MNNKKVPGYFLLEVVIYCAIATFLSWLTISQCLNRITFLSSTSSIAMRLCSINLASTVFMRIINQVPAQRFQWKQISEKSLIVAAAQSDIGLLIEDGKLWKLVGKYDAKNEQWQKKNKTMIMDRVEHGQFQVIMNTQTPQYIKAILLKAKVRMTDTRTYQLEQWATPLLMELS